MEAIGGEKMKISIQQLELALARSCKNARQLRPVVSQTTIQRIYAGQEIRPSTVGKLANALGVDPKDLLREE